MTYRADAVEVARKGAGAYAVYRVMDGVSTEYALRYRIDGENAGLWEVRDQYGALVAVERLKRHAVRLITGGVY